MGDTKHVQGERSLLRLDERFPLSAHQRDIWTVCRSGEESAQFTIAGHQRLHGPVDIDVLAGSLDRVTRRHDALLTRFGEADGVPYQWVGHEPLPVEVLDLSRAPDPAAACRRAVDAALMVPLRLRTDRLFHPMLLRQDAETVHIVLRAHHIVADGYALDLFLTRVLTDYESHIGDGSCPGAPDEPSAPDESSALGAPSAPGEPCPSYRSFVDEDLAYRGSPEHQADQDFFRERLNGAVPALFARRPARPGGDRRVSVTLEPEEVAAIRATGTSVFSYVAAALGTYLARLHGTDSAMLGVAFLNRRGPRHAATVGHFATTLPLLVPVGPADTLDSMAGRVAADVRAYRHHERLALGDMPRPAASGDGRRQLFDTTVSYLNLPELPDIGGLVQERTGHQRRHDQDALAILVVHHRNTDLLRIELDCAPDVFDDGLPPARVAEHLHTLIRHGLAVPRRPASRIPLLDTAGRADALLAAHGPAVPLPEGVTVHGLFAEQARRTPDRVAVSGAGSTTYATLDTHAGQVADALRRAGVAAEDRVAVLVERGPALPAALLGTLRTGAGYVPVDAEYPAERIAYLLRDSGAAALLVEESTAPLVPPGTAVPVIRVDSLRTPGGASHGDVSDDVADHVADDNLAYVIYTSGSTGGPKGVMVEHRSVVNRLAWMQRRYPIGPHDVILQKTPATFDVSVWELFWWAASGAAVAMLPPRAHRDPREILRAVAEHRVTVVHFVPAMLGPFLDMLEDEPASLSEAASLRYVFSSGEALTPGLVHRFNTLFAALERPPRLVNLYGPTEATVDVSCYDCSDHPAQGGAPVPIGHPVDNTQLYVLGPGDEPQPVGVPGELCIGGVQVARGYLGRPELSRERFTADPFTPGGRLYRTGDLARRTAGGRFEFLGRIDDQVKIRGHRVEPGEVQAALTAVPGVRAAAVVARTTPERGTHLVAYWTGERDISPAQLRTELARSLPEHLIPAFWTRVEALPLTPNGKLDRAALPAPEHAAEPSRPPRAGAESVLAAVWSQVLGAQVGVHDDFYALGGDSLLALRVQAEAERRGLRFEIRDLMRCPTVAALAEHTRPAGERSALAPFALVAHADRQVRQGAQDAFPLSRLQLGMVYHSLRSASADAEGAGPQDLGPYRDVFHYGLRMPWDEERLRRAYDRLTARHPALRSVISLTGFGEPLQIVLPQAPGGLECRDLRAASEAEADAELARYVEERRHHRYDFEAGPLHQLRAHARADRVDLVLGFHHAVLDGGSVAGLMGELLQDYVHGLGADVDAVGASSPPSPALYVAAELEALGSTDARAYWEERLRGATPLQLPRFATAEPPRETGRFTRLTPLPDGLHDRLRDFGRTHGLPLKSALFAAYTLTLRLLSGQDDVTTGLVVHGRSELPGADRTAGLFLNTLPVRVDAAPRSLVDHVRDLFRHEQDSYAHRHYPLHRIEEDFGGPLLDTAFNYVHLHALEALRRLPGLDLLSVRTWEESGMSLLVSAVVHPVDGNLWLSLDCDGRAFTTGQAELFTDTCLRVLERLVTHPDEQADLAFLAPEPDARPAEDAGAAYTDLARVVHARAEETPDAIALAFEDQRWTYRRLDRTADVITRRLLADGAFPGARVGIAMDRCPEYVAAVLGVLRAGCAVAPLDPGYPAARISAMIEAVRPFTVVTQRHHAGLLGDVPQLAAESLPAPSATDSFEPPPIGPADTCYVLCTSGSTGVPKAVAMPHRALSSLVDWQNRIPSGAVTGPTLQFSALGFDVHLQEIFATLCAGAPLQLVSEEQRLDFPALLRLLDRERVERLFLPYVALQQLAETSVALGLVPRALRVIISAGEQLRVTDEIRRLCAALPTPGVILENQYGPTETHIVTGFTMTGDPARFPALPPIGTAVDGSEVTVLDRALRPLPVGATGEIYAMGACLADGYEGQPDLTAERFVELPARPGHPAGPRAYRTGDLGYTLPGGDIVCLGRTDTQVKIRGFRIEPAEVELHLTATPSARTAGVSEAAVVARGEGPTSFLAAFLVADPGSVDLDATRRELRAQLPGHMVPSHLECLPVLPRTPSGKRDDAALRRIPLTRRALTSAAPSDALERRLAEIAAEALQLPAVGAHDDLFQLGATSLTVMRLVIRIEQALGTAVPVSALITAPTIAELAAYLRAAEAGSAAVQGPLVALRSSGTRRPVFLAHPTGGNVLCYLPLARALPPDQPLYGFQAAGLAPGTAPLRTVPEIARSYVAAMRTVQPHGPYTLGGWSFGGHIAFEMAAQLRAAGEEVAEVLLIDSDALDQSADRPEVDALSLMTWFFWELLWLDRGGDVPADAFRALRDEDDAYASVRELAVRTGMLAARDADTSLRRVFEMFRANWDALIDWRPAPTDQDLVLIRARGSLPDVLKPVHDRAGSLYHEPANGWRRLTTGRVRVVDVPGDHMQIVQDPYVHHVAAVLTDATGADATERRPTPSADITGRY
ncbi:amino acid adenylation domain-containing protein [Streptomyces actuosus]|uniref:Amino acid adenylation domain-containing protein n=1 Tax=Streptomyces griseosporeus TaxID=1910 RepID=A0ABV3KY23_STRGS|nr:amino acid adenylation domain-containing protein [Streptomyces actuosus]